MTVNLSDSHGDGNIPNKSVFDKTSLIPILALVGLGADGLSSSCYGPEEAYLAAGAYTHLVFFVALMSIFTIAVISWSYCNIIELFPRGGGGYVVASKLLNPFSGLVSGCALLVDYVLTITISIAAGVDAIFSLFPHVHHGIWEIKILCVILLTLLNLRGVKESVLPWVPIFGLFVITHLFAFGWSFINHYDALHTTMQTTMNQASQAIEATGKFGFLLILLRSFSMGAGTFTGIEAVSNGMSVIREPKISNAKRTMFYIAISLSLAVFGLVMSFLLYNVSPLPGQTINAVLFSKVGEEIGGTVGRHFPAITLLSETLLLFVAAETGFLGGPQIMSNMALDRWMPHRFVSLSDRFVMRHGVLLMGISATAMMMYTGGAVDILVVLYSLSVFITFTLSQLGMTLHWWKVRQNEPKWLRRLIVNGCGALLSLFILVSLTILKFEKGAWLSLLAVAVLVGLAMAIKSYYAQFVNALSKIYRVIPTRTVKEVKPLTRETKTAILLMGSVHGIARHTAANILSYFGGSFDHYIFMQVGLIDAGNFKGEAEIEGLKRYVFHESEILVKSMQDHGYSTEAIFSLGVDIADEIEKMARQIMHKYPKGIFFGGQLVLPKSTVTSRWLHNQTLFALQRRLYSLQYPFVIIPVYISPTDQKSMNFNPFTRFKNNIK